MFYNKLFKLPIYPINVEFIITNENETLKKHFTTEENPNPDIDDTIFATTYFGELPVIRNNVKYSCVQVVFNPFNEHCQLTYGTVAHEMVHVRSYIFDRIGHKVSFKNDEPEAYLLGYLVDEFVKFFNECQRNAAEQGIVMNLYTETYQI